MLINSWRFILVLLFLVYLFLSYQDIKYQKINIQYLLLLLPSSLMRWLFIGWVNTYDKIIEFLIIVLLILIARKLVQIGSGDVYGLLPIVLLFGYKDTLIIMMIATISFVCYGCIHIVLMKKSIRSYLPFIPFLFLGLSLYVLLIEVGL